ncbi:MAG TPA: epimerase, partial [Arachidicoccus sp.]
MKPFNGAKNTQAIYKYIGWIYPIARVLYPNGFITLQELGNAMINACYSESNIANFEGRDIIKLAKRLPQN